MEPISGPACPESPWLIVKDGAQKPLRKIIGTSALKAQEGINTRGANGIFFLKLIDNEDDNPYIQNMNEEGVKVVEKREGQAESDLLYPLR